MQFYLKRSFIYRPLEQEGSETRSEGFPTALSPISVRTEIGCPRGTSAKRLYFLKKRKTDCRGAKAPRNDKATAYRTHLAAFVATKWCVILNAKRERIRNSHFKRKRIATAVIRLRNDGGGETDCRAPNSLLRCPKVVIRLEREQLLTAALPFARSILHCRRSQRHSQ